MMGLPGLAPFPCFPPAVPALSPQELRAMAPLDQDFPKGGDCLSHLCHPDIQDRVWHKTGTQ